MTRALAVAVVVLGLTLGSSARAQVDFAKIRAGVQGCPQLAADAELGSLAAFFCEPVDRTILDLPISGVSSLIKVRAGSFSLLQRYPLLAVAQGTIPDSQYAALVDQLFAGQVPSIPVAAQSRALFAEAAQAEAAGDALLAAALRSQAEALIAGSFDAAIPDLLLARIDRDRLADLRAGRFTQIGGADTVASYASGLARNLNFVQLSGAPDSPYVPPELLTKAAFPFFVGPDGLGNTADDLPYVSNNPAAAAAGYVLATPIQGTAEDRFDRVQGAGVSAIPVYSKTAQITVPTLANPSVNKLIEVYGVYNPSFVKLNGCQLGLGGTYNRLTQICTDSGGLDITEAALAAGCPVIARNNALTAPRHRRQRRRRLHRAEHELARSDLARPGRGAAEARRPRPAPGAGGARARGPHGPEAAQPAAPGAPGKRGRHRLVSHAGGRPPPRRRSRHRRTGQHQRRGVQAPAQRAGSGGRTQRHPGRRRRRVPERRLVPALGRARSVRRAAPRVGLGGRGQSHGGSVALPHAVQRLVRRRLGSVLSRQPERPGHVRLPLRHARRPRRLRRPAADGHRDDPGGRQPARADFVSRAAHGPVCLVPVPGDQSQWSSELHGPGSGPQPSAGVGRAARLRRGLRVAL